MDHSSLLSDNLHLLATLNLLWVDLSIPRHPLDALLNSLRHLDSLHMILRVLSDLPLETTSVLSLNGLDATFTTRHCHDIGTLLTVDHHRLSIWIDDHALLIDKSLLWLHLWGLDQHLLLLLLLLLSVVAAWWATLRTSASWWATAHAAAFSTTVLLVEVLSAAKLLHWSVVVI